MSSSFLTATRRVLHTRLTHFPVTVERLVDPTLLTRPIAVISSPAQNGTIVDLSSEALQEGLTRGMRVSLARKVSRTSVLMPINRHLYRQMQTALFGRLTRFSPAVEPVGYGRFFLDMAGMTTIYRSYDKAAQMMLRDLITQLDLTPRVGIGRNKLVSAIAARVASDGPIRNVPRGDEIAFLAPLRSGLLPIITAEKMVGQVVDDLNLQLISQLQRIAEFDHLCKVAFHPFARQVAAQAQGIDTSLVLPTQLGVHDQRIIERNVLPVDTNDEAQLRSAIQHLADTVGYQLRRREMIARLVSVTTHYTDGYSSDATGRLMHNNAVAVTDLLLGLYERSNNRRNRIRAVTVEAGALVPFANQLDLFDGGTVRDQRLTLQLDRMRDRFGDHAIHTGLTLT